jgi:hypothetical protein
MEAHPGVLDAHSGALKITMWAVEAVCCCEAPYDFYYRHKNTKVLPSYQNIVIPRKVGFQSSRGH